MTGFDLEALWSRLTKRDLDHLGPLRKIVNGMDYGIVGDDRRRTTSPADYPVVAELVNDREVDLDVYLEMLCQHVVLSPGHRIELLARPAEGVLPIERTVDATSVTFYASHVMDPDWHVRFKGHLIKPAAPTRLADFEDIEGPMSALWPRSTLPKAPKAC